MLWNYYITILTNTVETMFNTGKWWKLTFAEKKIISMDSHFITGLLDNLVSVIIIFYHFLTTCYVLHTSQNITNVVHRIKGFIWTRYIRSYIVTIHPSTCCVEPKIILSLLEFPFLHHYHSHQSWQTFEVSYFLHETR